MGDPLPPKCAVIEVHVAELKQLFNSIDPSPFRNRDLDLKAEEFIVGWAKDMPRDAPNFDIGASHNALFNDSHTLARLIGHSTTPLSMSVADALKQ